MIGSRLRQMVFFSIVALISYVLLVNVLLPQSLGLALDSYSLTIIGKYLCFAMLAVALDLVWGYCGILSLGHAAFFSLGGYAMGMYLMRQIGERGTYGDPILPDFMVFLNWKELPWFWYGFDMFWFAGIMVFLALNLSVRVWLVCVSLTSLWCLPLYHHSGFNLRINACLLQK